jgi:hypothetical protein
VNERQAALPASQSGAVSPAALNPIHFTTPALRNAISSPFTTLHLNHLSRNTPLASLDKTRQPRYLYSLECDCARLHSLFRRCGRARKRQTLKFTFHHARVAKSRMSQTYNRIHTPLAISICDACRTRIGPHFRCKGTWQQSTGSLSLCQRDPIHCAGKARGISGPHLPYFVQFPNRL